MQKQLQKQLRAEDGEQDIDRVDESTRVCQEEVLTELVRINVLHWGAWIQESDGRLVEALIVALVWFLLNLHAVHVHIGGRHGGSVRAARPAARV